MAWRRYTDSLCLDARIRVSSGNGGLLNDFMLIDNHNLVDETDKSYDGVWIPKTEDGDKTAEVTLAEKSPVCTVALYDHPSEEHNILNAVICFDDGTQVETGPLDPGGAATVIEVAREAVSSFKVTLTETQGEDAGLSEIEAFARQPEADGRFIKLMDEEGNFLYDYRITEDGTAELSLYIHGSLPALTAGDYHIGITGQEGTAVIENGVIRVTCPPGETFTLTVACDSAGVSDSIFIRNPGMMERLWTDFWQKAEAALFSRYSRGDQNKLLICSIPEKISYVLRHMA